MKTLTALTLLLPAFGSSTVRASEVTSSVQTLQQQREQQQIELRLKMRQQQDNAVRVPAADGMQRLHLERDQLQRLQQMQEQQSRAALAADRAEGKTRRSAEIERERREGAEQLRRFENERR